MPRRLRRPLCQRLDEESGSVCQHLTKPCAQHELTCSVLSAVAPLAVPSYEPTVCASQLTSDRCPLHAAFCLVCILNMPMTLPVPSRIAAAIVYQDSGINCITGRAKPLYCLVTVSFRVLTCYGATFHIAIGARSSRIAPRTAFPICHPRPDARQASLESSPRLILPQIPSSCTRRHMATR
jgi:hypothetical protein